MRTSVQAAILEFHYRFGRTAFALVPLESQVLKYRYIRLKIDHNVV